MGKGDSVVLRQRISKKKLLRAKQLRKEMTRAERLLWRALRRNQVDNFHFRRQQIIAGFIVDFYCHAVRLVVEVDGDVHAGRREYDQERDRELQRYQLHVLRVTNDEILTALTTVVATIRALCNKRENNGKLGSRSPSHQERRTRVRS